MSNVDWRALQQQFWQAWPGSVSGGPEAAGSTGPAQEFWRAFRLDPTSPDAFNAWLAQLLDEFSGPTSSQAGAPFEAIRALFESPVSDFIGAFVKADGANSTKPFAAMAPSDFAALGDLPPLGLTREWASAWRELRQAQKAQLIAGGAFGRQLGRIYQTAVKRFLTSINRSDDEADITSFRGLYDYWISVAEQVYAEQVMTQEYSRAFGKFINTTAQVRKAWQTLADDFAETLNVPNRRELDSIIERQHAMQIDVRALASHHANDADIVALREEVAELTRKLAQATSMKSSDGASTRTARTKPSRSASTTARTPASKRAKTKSKAKTKLDKTKSMAPEEFDIGTFLGNDDAS